jgi:hypothetical protein
MAARTEASELYELELNLEDSLETDLEELANLETNVELEDVCFLGFLRSSQNLSLNTTVKMAEQTVCSESIKNL